MAKITGTTNKWNKCVWMVPLWDGGVHEKPIVCENETVEKDFDVPECKDRFELAGKSLLLINWTDMVVMGSLYIITGESKIRYSKHFSKDAPLLNGVSDGQIALIITQDGSLDAVRS